MLLCLNSGGLPEDGSRELGTENGFLFRIAKIKQAMQELREANEETVASITTELMEEEIREVCGRNINLETDIASNQQSVNHPARPAKEYQATAWIVIGHPQASTQGN
eukprot:348419-Amorphochlora_amoeboformis.AAC.2